MGIRMCPKCNGKVSTTRNDCIHCGYIFPPTKKCPDCEEEIDSSVLECPVCGYIFSKDSLVNLALRDKETTDPDKNKSMGTVASESQYVMTTNPNATSVTETIAVPILEEVAVLAVEETVAEDVATQISEEIAVPAVVEGVAPAAEEVVPSMEEAEKYQENRTEGSSTLVSDIVCPYCGSLEWMQIGRSYYMCQTCKGRFINTAESPSILPANGISFMPSEPDVPHSGSIPGTENKTVERTRTSSSTEKTEKDASSVENAFSAENPTVPTKEESAGLYEETQQSIADQFLVQEPMMPDASEPDSLSEEVPAKGKKTFTILFAIWIVIGVLILGFCVWGLIFALYRKYFTT